MITVTHKAWGCFATSELAFPRSISAYDAAYATGIIEAAYPLPAIKTVIECVPDDVQDHMHNCIIVWEIATCQTCGGYHLDMAALFDYDFDRSLAFNYPCGEYVHWHQIDEGLRAYQLASTLGMGSVH